MSLRDRLSVRRIETEATRDRALEVLATVYQEEKDWVSDLNEFFPKADLENDQVSWYVAEVDGQPVGVTRVLFEIPRQLYEEYAFELVDKSLDVAAFLENHRIAEIGRYAVLPEYRKRILVATGLMGAATTETLERGFTHFITDVFESDPNSPMKFHQRILGFQTVATHTIGELNHLGRRITMLLDLKESFQRLRLSNNWLFRYVTRGWNEQLVQQLSA
ncbi:MAG: GNAT family N-acetyltransferase [Acidobacteriota bacterium]